MGFHNVPHSTPLKQLILYLKLTLQPTSSAILGKTADAVLFFIEE